MVEPAPTGRATMELMLSERDDNQYLVSLDLSLALDRLQPPAGADRDK